MSDPKRLSPAETMRAIRAEAGSDAVDEVMALSPQAVDAALKAAGIEPAEAERRATAAIEAALASVGAAPEPAKSRVVPLKKAQARSLSRRWATLGSVAAAAAVAATVGVMNRSAIVAMFRGTEAIGPDRYGVPATSTQGPTAAEKALALRTAAFASCKESQWDWCEAQLDEASQLDPAGDTAPEVVTARKAIRKGHDDEMRKLKPPRK